MSNVIDIKKLKYDKELADELGISPAEVRRLRHEGKLMKMLIRKAEMDNRLREGRY